MGKGKKPPGVKNKIIHSRASYLHRAAEYLTLRATSPFEAKAPATTSKTLRNLSRHTLSNMRSVCLKAQIRQTPAQKRTVCKFCNAILIEGRTCRSTVRNESKGARKPWADVLEVTCDTCGGCKRFPVRAKRQPRRTLRAVKKGQGTEVGDQSGKKVGESFS